MEKIETNPLLIAIRHASVHENLQDVESQNRHDKRETFKYMDVSPDGAMEAVFFAKYLFERFMYAGMPMVDIIFTSTETRSIQTANIISITLKHLLRSTHYYAIAYNICIVSDKALFSDEVEEEKLGTEAMLYVKHAMFSQYPDKKCALVVSHEPVLKQWFEGHSFKNHAEGIITRLHSDENNPENVLFVENRARGLTKAISMGNSAFRGIAPDTAIEKLIDSNEVFQKVLRNHGSLVRIKNPECYKEIVSGGESDILETSPNFAHTAWINWLTENTDEEQTIATIQAVFNKFIQEPDKDFSDAKKLAKIQ